MTRRTARLEFIDKLSPVVVELLSVTTSCTRQQLLLLLTAAGQKVSTRQLSSVISSLLRKRLISELSVDGKQLLRLTSAGWVFVVSTERVRKLR